MTHDAGRPGAGEDTADPRLMAALRATWEQRDPVPPGLVEAVLAQPVTTAASRAPAATARAARVVR